MDLNIYAKETALVLIDMQNIAMQFYSNSNPDIVAKCREMVDFAHENGIKVIYTQLNRRADVKDQTINRSELNISLGSIEPAPVYVEGTKEAAIIDDFEIKEEDFVVTKRRMSAVHDSGLELILRSNKIQTVILGGVATEFGVLATGIDLRDFDHDIIFAMDCCATCEKDTDDFCEKKIFPTIGRCLRNEEIKNITK